METTVRGPSLRRRGGVLTTALYFKELGEDDDLPNSSWCALIKAAASHGQVGSMHMWYVFERPAYQPCLGHMYNVSKLLCLGRAWAPGMPASGRSRTVTLIGVRGHVPVQQNGTILRCCDARVQMAAFEACDALVQQ